MLKRKGSVTRTTKFLNFSLVSIREYLFRLLGLGVFDAIALWLLSRLFFDRIWPMFAVIAVITLGINIVFLFEKLYPFQWMSPGLALMILLVIYPLIFTIYNAFTNYNQTHLLTKLQVVQELEGETFISSDSQTYSWTAFRSAEGSFAVWLISAEGKAYLALPGKPLEQPLAGQNGIGELDEKGIPVSIDGYERLTKINSIKFLPELTQLKFGTEPGIVVISSSSKAGQYQQKYSYNPDQDQLVDHETGKTYQPVNGNFTSADGEQIDPGFQITVGWKNFIKLFNSPTLRGPLVMVFIWTIIYAVLSVLLSFGLGLTLAVTFQNSLLPRWLKETIRSLLLMPFVIPFFLSVLIWRGMFNQNLGVINRISEALFHWSALWFTDPFWARTAIIIITVWLSYPYMMLISTGALQSISSDVYEAARMDGASGWQQFWNITLPLLLIAVGPLLVASFAGAFNNFGVIYLYNGGGPPIPNSPTPAGYTDILLSYVYNTSFGGGAGSYSYASAITIVIFIIVALITLVQFRQTRIWEEVA